MHREYHDTLLFGGIHVQISLMFIGLQFMGA